MKRNAGFSLIETLFALFIMGISLVGLTQAVTFSLRSSKDSERHSSAVFLATERMEMVRADKYLLSGTTEGDFGETFPLYAWKETVTETQTDGLYDIVVEVSLKETGATIYEVRTRLFDMPFESTLYDERETERDRRDRPRGGGRRRRRY